MAQGKILSVGFCKSQAYTAFLVKGWIPDGTEEKDAGKVTMGQMGFDSPGLSHAPNLQKDVMGLDLIMNFAQVGSKIPNPAVHLRTKSLTLDGLALKIHASQKR